MQAQAPRQLNYEDVLPVAIESSSQRREFYPEGGSTYGPNGGTNPNVVRIPINADAMLDAQGSYLQFVLENTSALNTIGLDFPQSIIKRLRILSGSGTVLEDIGNYNRLYGGILYPTQASAGFIMENSITAGQDTASDRRNANTQMGANASKTMCVHLCSALLNSEKYLPLVMMNAGLILELELDVPNSAGVCSAVAGCQWTVSNFRYVAHLINLQRDFYEKLRLVMEGSGGVLQLAGTTYKHFSGNWSANTESNSINIPARVKSIKSIVWKNTIEVDVASHDKFGVSDGVTHGLTEYQFRIGSVSYPPQSIKFSATNKGEAYCELRKAFGTLGDYSHGGALLNKDSYGNSPATGSIHDGVVCLSPFAIDLESFPRTSLESGVSTSDRALPITLDLKATAAAIATTVDVWCMCDAIFYVNLDGSCSVSV